MAIQLFKATAGQLVPLGPFLDDTDGKTAETGLSIANTDIKLWKEGATSLVNKNSGGATHMANGVYYITLDATDTSIFGSLVIFCHKAGALPVRVECYVEDPTFFYKHFNYYRSIVFATATGTPTTTTIPITTHYPDLAASSVDGTYVGAAIYQWIGSGLGAVSRVTAYNGTTKVLTLSPPLPAAPNTGDSFFMVPTAVGVLADNAITSGTIATDAIDADALAASAVSEMQSGLALDATVAKAATVATASALSTVSGYVDDLESRLTATRAGYLDNLNSGVTLTAGAIDAIVDEVIEGSTTLRQALRLILATAAGKSAGGGTSTVTFRDMADSKNRISASVDANGNRTSVTRDAS